MDDTTRIRLDILDSNNAAFIKRMFDFEDRLKRFAHDLMGVQGLPRPVEGPVWVPNEKITEAMWDDLEESYAADAAKGCYPIIHGI